MNCSPTAYKNFGSSASVFNELFDSAFNTPAPTNQGIRYDVYTDKEHYFVDLEIPGIAKDKVDIDIENRVLKVIAEYPELDKKYHYAKKSRFNGKVEQSFKLSGDLDVEAIVAKHDNGVLQLQIPIRKEVKGRKINID